MPVFVISVGIRRSISIELETRRDIVESVFDFVVDV